MAKKNKVSIVKVLKKLAPGTELREGLEYIIGAKTGALIVIGDTETVLKLCNGGFSLDGDFSAQKLFELAKMDGAIILDEDLTRILSANVHLVPDSSLPTSETGMRHRTAERVARQTKAMVISISQRRDVISIYVAGAKYVLEDLRVLLTKANQALQTLERYKSRLDQISSNLNALEFEDLVTLMDVATLLQRSEMVRRISREIESYIIELGMEGRLIQLQLEELMAGVEEENLMAIKDYCRNSRRVDKAQRELEVFTPEELLEPLAVCEVLGYKDGVDLLDQLVHPRGYRLLKRIPRLPITVIENIVLRFKDLQTILSASIEELDEVDGVGEVRARAIQEGLRRLREYSLLERYA